MWKYILRIKVLYVQTDKETTGVYIYIINDYTFSLLQDIKIEGMGSIWIEIMLPKRTINKPTIVSRCTWNRPPTSNSFLELLEHTLNKLISHCEQIIILVSQLSYNSIMNMSIRVHDVSDAGICSVIRVSSLGMGRRKKHVTSTFVLNLLMLHLVH